METPAVESQITAYAPARWRDAAICVIGLFMPVLMYFFPGHSDWILIGTISAVIIAFALFQYRLNFDKSLRNVDVVAFWLCCIESSQVQCYSDDDLVSVALRKTINYGKVLEISFQDGNTYRLHEVKPTSMEVLYESLCHCVNRDEVTRKT